MGFLILGIVLILTGILGFAAGQMILAKKKRVLKDKFRKVQEG